MSRLNRPGESGDSGWCLAGLGEDGILTVVGSLKLGWRNVTAGFVEPPVVEPVDVFEGGDFDLAVVTDIWRTESGRSQRFTEPLASSSWRRSSA
jgi:hypothetical protein